jgi:hypothetical protein
VRFFLNLFSLARFGFDNDGHLEHDSLAAAAIDGIVGTHDLGQEAFLTIADSEDEIAWRVE